MSRDRWPIIFGIVGAVASGPVLAQDLTQGKSSAQLFASDCAACHKSPQGLAKGDIRSIAGFLREHYTTKPEMADALASYLLASGRVSAGNEAGRSDWNRNESNRNMNMEGLRPRGSIPIADEAKLPEAGESPKPSAKLRGTASGDTGKPTDYEPRRSRSTSAAGDVQRSTEDGLRPPRVVPDARRDADDDTAIDAPRPKPRTTTPVPAGKLNGYARSGSGEKDKVTESAESRLGKLRSYANSGDAAPAAISAPPKAVTGPPPVEPAITTVTPGSSSDTERAATRQEPKSPSEDPTRSELSDAPKPMIDDAAKPPKLQRPGDGARSQDGATARPMRRTDAAANTPSSPMSFLGRILSGGAKRREGDPIN